MAYTILLVDPYAAQAAQIKSALDGLAPQIIEVPDKVRAIETVRKNSVDLVILGPSLAMADSLEFLKTIKDKSQSASLPVIFVAGPEQAGEKLKAFEAGAQEYLTLPFEPEELTLRVKNIIRLKNTYEELNRRIKDLEQQANVDSLTGLFNRKYLMDSLRMEASHGRQHRFALACLMIDVDNFKAINDNLGHEVGDQALKEIGQRLDQHMRGYDFAARYGGDEFAVLLPHSSKGGSLALAERLRHEIDSEPFLKASGRSLHLSISIGIAAFQAAEVEDEGHLLRIADRALYEAKQHGRNCIAIAEDPERFRVQPPKGLYRRNYRKFQRYSFTEVIRLTDTETQRISKGHTVNIGYGGMTVYSREAFQEKAKVQVCVPATESAGEKKEETMLATVRWVRQVDDLYLVGLEFDAFAPQDHPSLWGFIQEAERLSPH